MLLGCCAVASLSFALFAALCLEAVALPHGARLAALYATSVLAALAVNSTAPLYYELAVEACYPIAEGLTTSILTVAMNVVVLGFLAVQAVPDVGTAWMNPTVAVAAVAALLVLLPVPEHRARLALDTGHAAVPA